MQVFKHNADWSYMQSKLRPLYHKKPIIQELQDRGIVGENGAPDPHCLQNY